MPVPVAQNLHLNVAGTFQILFQVQRGIAKGILGFRTRRAIGGLEFGGGPHETQSLAAPARRGLEHQGITDAFRHPFRCLEIRERLVRAWDHRQARLHHRVTGPRLRAHQLHRAHGRSNKDHAGIRRSSGKRRVLRQIPVTRVNRIRPALPRRIQQVVDTQITFAGLGRSDAISLIGVTDVQ